MSSSAAELGRFVADAPPGELDVVIDDIKAIVDGNPALVSGLDKDIAQYHADDFTIVKLPGSGSSLVTKFNQISGDKFFDAVKGIAFTYDFSSGTVTDTEPYEEASSSVKSLDSKLEAYVAEHFPSDAGHGVFPQSDGSIVLVIVDNRYNPNNFWNGQWKSWYTVDSSSSSATGSIQVRIHYFEDGNVRLDTKKDLELSGSLDTIVKRIGLEETKYQQEVNRAFVGLNEGSFKALRRQLPVTRSKMTWGKAVGNYRLGQDIGGKRE